jgi:hypothetical protein
MKKLLVTLAGCCTLLVVAYSSAYAQTPSNPIMFVTVVPNAVDSATQTAAFGNHLTGVRNALRGGDLWIRYGDGTLRNLTKEAGYGNEGIQGDNSIAVREPSVHFSGKKAIFSMVVGTRTSATDMRKFYWQLYEVTGLGKDEKVQITKVPNQPLANNISPIYGSDEHIIFVSDNYRLGKNNGYDYLDENLAMATNSGLWSLNPANGNIKHLDHSPSGDFNPTLDSYGRIVFTRWDIMQQDMNLNSFIMNISSKIPSTYSTELPDSLTTKTNSINQESFPESNPMTRMNSGGYFDPPRDTSIDPLISGNNPVLDKRLPDNFFPWAINQDGSNAQTINHIGRHDLARAVVASNQQNNPQLLNFIPDTKNRKNRNSIFNLFTIREDPNNQGVFYGIDGLTALNHGAGQIVRFQGVKPTDKSSDVTVDYITHRATRTFTPTNMKPNVKHTGFYRSPLPTTDGLLVASHSPNQYADAPTSSPEIIPNTVYSFRLCVVNPGSGNGDASPKEYLIKSSITKNVINTDYDYSSPRKYSSVANPLWEMDPVEVVAHATPNPHGSSMDPIERSVFEDENVDVNQFTAFLEKNNQAVVVSRDITMRDASDRQQPFNLRVAGTTKQSQGVTGQVSDVSDVMFFQADYRRGYMDRTSKPLGSRRVLPTPMHDVLNRPYSPILGKDTPRSSSVKIENDGSWAAFVPSSRALSWQLANTKGEGVVRERYWLNFKAGEVRACVKCHGENQEASVLAQPAPTNKPLALRNLLRVWKEDNYPSRIQQTLPANKSINVSFPIRLQWNADQLAKQYEVIVKAVSGNGDIEVYRSTVSGTSMTVTAQELGTTYKQFVWEVRGLGDWGGRSETIVPYTFSTDGTLSSEEIVGNSSSVQLQPNPAGHSVRLRYALEHPQTVSITLTDNLGNSAFTLNGIESGLDNDMELPLGDIPTGVYTVRIVSESGELRKRLVIVR